MDTAFGVIGANYGDEGKGRNVDALAHELGGRAVTVVRSNGGAQAGHTVVTPDGRRHVFHHIGSGAYAGASTHLSRFFVHHPMTFMDERDALAAQGACVDVSADPRGMVTTPWDMMVNQVVEVSRGGGRHGSCGYGLGETVGRNEETPHRLVIADLSAPDLHRRLSVIRDEWLPARLARLGVVPDADTARAIASPALMQRYIDDCAALLLAVAPRGDATLADGGTVVFEGAQGLLLDQRSRDFPHVTRSNTGVGNMAAIAREAGIGRIEALYATRCYLTRHGAGPMPRERDISSRFAVVDATNVPNPWQSAIRYGLLDLDLLTRSIREDAAKGGGVIVVPSLAVSCLDQAVDGSIPFVQGGRELSMDARDFAHGAARAVGAQSLREWWSPGRDAFRAAA